MTMRFVAFSLQILGLAALGAASTPLPAHAAPATTSTARGKILYLRCAACHTLTAQAPSKVGPHLQGVVGRKSGAVANFAYSPAFKKAKLTWDEATLDRWLQRPASVVPGTSMVFAGMPNADDRKALIAYLKKPAS